MHRRNYMNLIELVLHFTSSVTSATVTMTETKKGMSGRRRKRRQT